MPIFSDYPISSVVIAGAGGFGLELFDYLEENAAQGGPAVAGFIDDTSGLRVPDGINRPLLGDIRNFRAQAGQVVLVAVGSVKGRMAVLAALWANGVRTPAFAANSAIVSPAAILGEATVICPLAIINRNAQLGVGVVVNVHCSVGHGASIGDYSVLSPYAALNGEARLGRRCFLGSRATVYPGISIGDDCVIDSHTGVRAHAEEKKIISSRSVYQVNNLRIF